MSAIKNLVRQQLEELANCFDCGDYSTFLDNQYPHFIDYLNGMYATEHRQECWPSPATFILPFQALKSFHEGGHVTPK